jgi:hypothetical protein
VHFSEVASSASDTLENLKMHGALRRTYIRKLDKIKEQRKEYRGEKKKRIRNTVKKC